MIGRILLLIILFPSFVQAADWPTWRYDARRSAASPQELASTLHLHWRRDYPPEIPAWPEQEMMPFDVCYEPVVAGQTLFMNSGRQDCIRAIDTRTGERKWIFFAEGPIRFAPLAWEGKLYFVSDDGYLYCIDAEKGTLNWKFRGGPSDRKILGNERLISTWPARGAPVLMDETVYFAAGIWPFMGIFIHAVDARTGQSVWTNDGDGAMYIKQPHSADAFAGVAPQGTLVAIRDYLLLPGGRSVPALFDRKTGKFLRYQLEENSHKGGGAYVGAVGDFFFNGGGVFGIEDENYLGEIGRRTVLPSMDRVFAYLDGQCRAYDVTVLQKRTKEEQERDLADPKKTPREPRSWKPKLLGTLKTPVIESLIQAGKTIYAGGDDFIMAIEVSADGQEMKVASEIPIKGKVRRLVAADDRLFAATTSGSIYCFGQEEKKPKYLARIKVQPDPKDDWVEKAKKILDLAQVHDGYCIVWGWGSGRLVSELLQQSGLRIIVLEPDAEKLQAIRRKYTALDQYGTRLSIHHGDPETFAFPPYLASLMVSEDAAVLSDKIWPSLYHSLRPYGGAACFFPHQKLEGLARAMRTDSKSFANATVQEQDGMVLLRRTGALPDAADWTHEHADAANTRVSKDKLVKAPLGVLWFGGPSHKGILPRHGHGPQPQVIEGRILIEGMDLMRAIDIYTGRLVWETRLPGVGQFYNNVAHQPGANASGSNFVCMPDGIYVAVQKSCVKLDPATGKKLAIFDMPPLPTNASSYWGYLNVAGDYLIGGGDPILPKAFVPRGDPLEEPKSKSLAKVLSLVKGGYSDNMSSSRHLVVMDRQTGKVLWSIGAKHGFRHNGTCIGGDTLFIIDRPSSEQLAKLRAKKIEPEPAWLYAFDLKTGKLRWCTQQEVFGTWLSYSAKRDILVEAGRLGRDVLSDEPRGMRAYQAKDGTVLWFQSSYVGPAILHGDTILQGTEACDLLTGKLKMREDPITGQLAPWRWVRNHGCNTPAASEHLLTFRSGAAGYFDLRNDGGTGNFGGFRSSCTNNLIVAGGVLTCPEYTRTCTCTYQNQASVGMIHLPENEMWAFFGTKEIRGPIKRLGLNLGAIGDRRAEDGALWLEIPSTGGLSPDVKVNMKPDKMEWFRRHSSQVEGPLSWVTSSGAVGLQELTVDLGKTSSERKYTLRLYFAEPAKMRPGERVFDVLVQGQPALSGVDIVKQAGGPMRSLVKELTHVSVVDRLTIQLIPRSAALPILCGVEFVLENP